MRMQPKTECRDFQPTVAKFAFLHGVVSLVRVPYCRYQKQLCQRTSFSAAGHSLQFFGVAGTLHLDL
jgi:hypothetical protein